MNEVRAPERIYNAPVTGDNSPSAHATVGVGLFIAVTALVLSAFASGMAVVSFVYLPQIIDSKIAAAVAKQDAQIELNEQQADLARDTAYRMKAQLEQKGLIPSEGH